MADVSRLEEAIYETEDYLTVTQAMTFARVTRMTMISWCKKYRIGIRVGGLWKVHPDKLALFLRGRR